MAARDPAVRAPHLRGDFAQVIHAGPPAHAKTAAQLVAAATLEAIAEALKLGEGLRCGPECIRDGLLEGTAASRLLTADSRRMIDRDFEPRFPLWVFVKDAVSLDNALEGTGVELPVAQEVFRRIRELAERGDGELDQTALYRLLDP